MSQLEKTFIITESERRRVKSHLVNIMHETESITYVHDAKLSAKTILRILEDVKESPAK